MERSAERARSRKKRNQDRGFTWRSARGWVLFIEMIENASDHLGLGDEGNDAKLVTAGTEEWVGLVNPPDQISPTLSECGTMFGSELGLISF